MFCDGPSCPRGLVWPESGQVSHLCPDCGRATRPFPTRPCDLCGLEPTEEGLVVIPTNRLVCHPCRDLIHTGALMVRKHGLDRVRDILYAAALKTSEAAVRDDPSVPAPPSTRETPP